MPEIPVSDMIRRCRLHAVTDQATLESPDFAERARVLAGTGKVALALRGHTLSGRELYDRALILREITSAAGVPLIINTRVDVALAVCADFVQLGYHSIPLEACAPLCRERGLAFGCSCHSAEQVDEALKAGAAYVYLGTIFATGSKPGVKPAGIGLVREICGKVRDIPVFAIGGMSPDTAPEVAEAGAFGCAAVSALWHSSNPEETVKAVERMAGAFEI